MAQETRETSAGQAALTERARRILLHEQRTGHQDGAVKPGGLEAFVTHWASEARAVRGPSAEQDGAPPEDAVARLLAGYRGLDPMQRASRVRAALAVLDTASGAGLSEPRPTRPRPIPTTATPATPLPSRATPPAHHAPPVSAPARIEAIAPPPRTPRREPTTMLRPEDEYLLRAPVTAVPGVGATQEERLARLGIETVRDLLQAYPRDHQDYSKLQKIATLPFDEVCTVLGVIWEVTSVRLKGSLTKTTALIRDETGGIRASWFNQPYLLKQLPRGAHIVVTGVKQRFGNRVDFAVKSHELPEQGDLINT
ncbi:MAG TPA: hypothetical protein VGR88_08370, partial [Ktedonobacterales bacterium]|nr:hypothetical protein [Ktedonobacterales bacterium]